MKRMGLELALEIRVIIMIVVIAGACSMSYVPGFCLHLVLLFLYNK